MKVKLKNTPDKVKITLSTEEAKMLSMFLHKLTIGDISQVIGLNVKDPKIQEMCDLTCELCNELRSWGMV